MIVICLLIYRHLWRVFPAFFIYTVQTVISEIGAAIIIHNHRSAYVTWYLTETITDSVLLFAVLVELAWSILRPVRASLSRSAIIPVIGMIALASAAVWPFASLSGLTGASGGEHYIVQLQQTVSILLIIFFLVLIASSQLFSIGWRDRELQLATGFGFFSFVSIATTVLNTHQTSYIQYKHMFRIEIGAYICSLLYWTYCLTRKETERRAFTPEMQRILLTVAGAAHATRVALNEPQTGKPRK